jgi:hypothetical protein
LRSVHQSTMLFFALSAVLAHQCINPQCCSLRSVHQSTMLFFACAALSASIHNNAVLALGASIHNAVLCVCTALRAWGPHLTGRTNFRLPGTSDNGGSMHPMCGPLVHS